MTFVETCAQTPAAQALGAALLHFLWQGAVIAAALAAVLLVSRGAGLRYRAAVVAMASMPVAFAATSWAQWTSADGMAATVGFGTAVFPESVGLDAALPAMAPSWSAWLLGHAGWTVPFWLLGVAAISLRRFAGWEGARRLRTSGVYPPPAKWVDRLGRLADAMDVRVPALRESVRLRSPAVTGFVKPMILVPAGFFASCPPGHVEAILMHELAHIARQDYLVAAVAGAIESLFFFHPAVFWVSRVIRREREHCCDDIVVAHTGDARGYASALAGLEQIRDAATAPTLGAAEGDLLGRVRRLLAV